MKIDYDKMCEWEMQKAVFLQKVAIDIGMDLTGYGEIGVNPNSGYTYIWLEDYNFSLYMPISCELKITDVSALYTDPEDGTETELDLTTDTTLSDIEDWISRLESKTNCKNNDNEA
jgi:hypothetical protein